jgi:GTPase Era involved in 16S rRNA processing
MESEFLSSFDLIDMPGSSDPNMPLDFWTQLLGEIDLVIWCTPASQAWRQSEAAMWEQLPELIKSRSLLLITRMDKILSERDRHRVLHRVRRETDGAFSDVLPISLTQALSDPNNPDVIDASGADAMFRFLADALHKIDLAERSQFVGAPLTQAVKPCEATKVQPDPAEAGQRILPRRIVGSAGARLRTRPSV